MNKVIIAASVMALMSGSASAGCAPRYTSDKSIPARGVSAILLAPLAVLTAGVQAQGFLLGKAGDSKSAKAASNEWCTFNSVGGHVIGN